MSLDILCSTFGINTGGPGCPVTPGTGKYVAIWGGKITKAQLLAGYLTTKAQLVTDSKRSKNDSSKLILLPVASDFKPTKESNTVATLPDGYSQVTREGLPKYEIVVRSDMYAIQQIRKLNGKRIRYCIIDSNNLFLGTVDTNGDFMGRGGKLFTDGIDAHGFDQVDGVTTISIQAETAAETYDFSKAIQLDKDPTGIFASLKDIQLYEKVTATPVVAVAAANPTRTVTITAIGADGDTIDIKYVGANSGLVSLVAAPVAKTASETTVTLLAAKIVTAINGATSTNGGFTATNSAGVITITGPSAFSPFLNTINTAPTIVGTMTATSTAFSGGVIGTYSTTLHVSGKMDSPIANVVIDFYAEYSTTALGSVPALWKATRTSTGDNVPVTVVSPNVAGYFDVTPTPATVASMESGETLEINLVPPPTLDASLVVGIEGLSFLYTKP